MTLRKITIDNSVRYVPESKQTKEGDSKPKTGSLPRKQNKNFSKSHKKFVEEFAVGGFGIFK